MKILILGGTQFLGRALAEASLSAGHDITLFNRGNTNPDLFPDVEKLRGDRDGDLSALEGRTWDAVFDTSAYIPRIARASAELLKDSVEHYTFISSISVYGPPMDANLDESGAVQELEDESVEQVTGETYGALKALCEKAIEEVMPGRMASIRAGLIVGPHDPTDRFTYLPVKVARGGEMLTPPRDSVAQFIDVRDLSEWIVRLTESRKTGKYNATGPDTTLTFADILDACVAVADNPATLVEASDEFLIDNEVAPWGDLPLWLPDAYNAMLTVNVGKAVADGLTFRPVEETVRDTLTWFKDERGLDEPLRAGLDDEREAELLAKLKKTIG